MHFSCSKVHYGQWTCKQMKLMTCGNDSTRQSHYLASTHWNLHSCLSQQIHSHKTVARSGPIFIVPVTQLKKIKLELIIVRASRAKRK